MNIILFFKGQTTYKFDQVSNLKVSENKVEFDYYGLSTDTHRHAVFMDVLGYSSEITSNPLSSDGLLKR